MNNALLGCITSANMLSVYIFNLFSFVGKYNEQEERHQAEKKLLEKKYATQIKELEKDNNTLLTQSLTDHSTGLWNKRHLTAILGKEVERMKRLESDSLKLLLLDIDNYKKVNDSLGHKFGDLLAIEFANLLKRNFRYSDYVFRTGGDEYMVLMRDAGDKTINTAIQRVRSEIKKIIIKGKNVGSLIDVSIGLSSFDHNNPDKDMAHEADTMMYREKKQKK